MSVFGGKNPHRGLFWLNIVHFIKLNMVYNLLSFLEGLLILLCMTWQSDMANTVFSLFSPWGGLLISGLLEGGLLEMGGGGGLFSYP